MKLVVAGTEKEFDEGLSVEDLLRLEKVEYPQYVTVTINNAFVQNRDRAETILHEGDKVEFLYFMGGGC